MADDKMAEYAAERERLSELMQNYANLEMKRFLTLDQQVYAEGALPAPTKELLGLVASLVLRCDDCIIYHLNQCHILGVTSPQLVDALSISLVTGGSITIPHIRRALAAWDELQSVSADSA
jgi:AhpD family alkylhydroperoxidase